MKNNTEGDRAEEREREFIKAGAAGILGAVAVASRAAQRHRRAKRSTR